MKSGNLNFLESSGPLQACNGTALHLTRKQQEYLRDGSIDGNLKFDRVEPGYNDISLSETSSIASNILWYQLLPHCYP